MKYSRFHYEQKRNYKKKKPYRAENFTYHEAEDEYECPQGKRLRYVHTQNRKSINGFWSERRIYACEDCSQCPVKEDCTRAKGNRQIQIGIGTIKAEGKREPGRSPGVYPAFQMSD